MGFALAAATIGGPILGGLIQADAIEDAASAQAAASDRAIGEQRRQYDIGREDLAPWRESGRVALGELMGRLGLSSGSGAAALPRSLEDIAGELRSSGRFGQPAAMTMPLEPRDAEGNVLSTASNEYQELLRQSTPTIDENALMAEAQRIYDAQVPVNREYRAFDAEGDRPMDDLDLDRRLTPEDLATDALVSSSPVVQSTLGISPVELNRQFTVQQFWDDPVTQLSFQSGLDEGRKALDRMAGSRGMRNSGQTLKALTRFGTDYTGQKAEGSYNRFQDEKQRLLGRFAYADTMRGGAADRFEAGNTTRFNRLATLAGLGQQATGTGAQIGANTSNNIANIIASGGNARGAAAIAQGNVWGNAFNNIGNWWNQQNMLNNLRPTTPSSGVNLYDIS